ncbi:MAG TPA: hypothetical protein VGM14_25585 [Streptosporangiaceae bacterium]
MEQDHGPVTVAVDGWTIRVQHGLPASYQHYRHNAELLDEFDLPDDEGDHCFVAVNRGGEPFPRLVVAQRYSPSAAGFEPGVAFVPETAVLFAGAGTRLLAYTLRDRPRRLWEDAADMGFWHWSVHPSAVLMAAELELAAWTKDGAKLWTMFVEPPWSYQVAGDQVELDVMGRKTQFPISSGPA